MSNALLKGPWITSVIGILIALVGLVLAGGGAYLVSLGRSWLLPGCRDRPSWFPAC